MDGQASTSSEDSSFRDYRGYFVFPDDASDIKAHPFFDGIDWARLHLLKPPEVPKVRDRFDTRYFDIQSSTSDSDDASRDSAMQEEKMQIQEEFEDEIVKNFEAEVAKATNLGQFDGTRVIDELVEAEMSRHGATHLSPGGRLDGAGQDVVVHPRERKRARDKILRDLATAKDAMELRKIGAFMGYTYRRPREMLAHLDSVRGSWRVVT